MGNIMDSATTVILIIRIKLETGFEPVMTFQFRITSAVRSTSTLTPA